MKRFTVFISLVGCLVCLGGCASALPTGNDKPTATTTATAAPTSVDLFVGTTFDAVGQFSKTHSAVWQFLSTAESETPRWEPMTHFFEDEGTGLVAWAPSAAHDVSLGISAVHPDYLQLHSAGVGGRMVGLRFVSPADAVYRVTGVLLDEWDECAKPLTLTVGDTCVKTVPCDGETPFETEVKLCRGESLTAFVPAEKAGDPIAVYLKLTLTVKTVLSK